ncbi:MAG TPA: peptidoglycan-binding protein LysM, partial [Microbacteriaceae bacterium]|nr:peptidoglycan-binding protein LysM [Microbacteriaceae bacterium]
NPDYAIRTFFLGPPDDALLHGLLDVPGWQQLSFSAAAQAVQNSAYPALYARWEEPARVWLAALSR